MSFRWYYVDDSGSPQSGWIVYGFVQVAAEDWSAALDHWLQVRDYLLTAYGIDAYTELHAYRFINGRGNPSKDPEWNRCKALRHQVAVEVLQAVARMPGVRVGAVARHTDARRDAYAREQLDVYRCFLDGVTDRLRAAGEYGTVVMDGNGTDSRYKKAHRQLKPTRRIIEDPAHQQAHQSYLVQAADLVSYVAYQAVLRDPARIAIHDWFCDYLGQVGTIAQV
ncbi:DUF3800 domain-containing protein [Catenulispora rubra]|uniref:DUF3800 domain-containing protein n=1 Tax=Catenulispora rubra TaxID=280293 RepID=UPI001892344B|nr:DUF3800 domain-containing protein [Catenulispora rubra]